MATTGEPQPAPPPSAPLRVQVRPPMPSDAPAGSAPRVRVGGSLVVAAWLIVALLVLVVLQLQSVRANQVAIQESIGRTPETVVTVPAVTTAPALDLPPADGEASRRAISDAYRAVFSPSTPQEVWSTLVVDPGDLGPRLAALAGTPCGSAVPMLTAVRFVGDDDAVVDFGFDGVSAAQGVPLQGRAQRQGGTWKVTSETVSQVLDLAAGVC